MHIRCGSLTLISLSGLASLLSFWPVVAQEFVPLKGVSANSVAYSGDGKWICAGGTIPSPSRRPEDISHEIVEGLPGSLKVWETKTGAEVFQLTEPDKNIACLAFSPKNKVLAVGYCQKGFKPITKVHPLILWDILAKRRCLTLPAVHAYDCLAFSPDGKWLATGAVVDPGKVPTLTVWVVASGKQQRKWELRDQPKDYIMAVAFSPDGSHLAFGGRRGVLHVADFDSGKLDIAFSGHSDHIRSIAFSPDGKWLASASFDKTVRVYNWRKKKLAMRVEAHNGGAWGLAFSTDGKTLFTAGIDHENPADREGDWKAWEIPKGGLLHTVKGHTSPIISIAVSPDGREVLTGARDGTVRRWPLPKHLAKKQ